MEARDVLRFKTVVDVACSPDGSQVAYTIASVDTDVDDYRTAIWVAPVDGRPDLHPRQLTDGPKKDSAPRWSPDGEWLAFLSDRERDKPQLYVMPASGGEARRLTDLALGTQPATWSPDSSKILVSARVPDTMPPADPDAKKRWEQRPRHVTKAQYKADGQGYTFDARAHLFLIDVKSGKLAQITDGDFEDRAESWSPDGTRIAWSRTRGGRAEYSWSDIWSAKADGSDAKQLTTDAGRATSPTWSPDGKWVAFYAADEPTPWIGDPMVRPHIVASSGGASRPITKEYDHGVALLPPPAATPGPAWSSDGTTVTAIFTVRGQAHVVRANVKRGETKTIVGGERQVTYLSASPARLAYAAADPRDPSEVYTSDVDGKSERRLTELNAALVAELDAPIPSRRVFDTPNGKIEGWVIVPRGTKGPAPLILDIHGGPAGFAGDAFALAYFFKYVLASRGWAVLSLNPTGSGSYGREHAHGIRGKWGEHDLPEQLAAIDALVKDGIADPDRLAIAGYSYGGFMTSWTIGHTDRFKAAIVGAPVVDQESFHGTSDIGMWFAPWELNAEFPRDREALRRFSPITYVDKVTTPTLILHGEADERCPIGQGEQYFAALLACGRVPVEFVRYPGGSHLFIVSGRPSHRSDFNQRVVDWVARHTP
ncbi:MAG TPA: S9 family peptidase [Candidatus Limnocylindrales bacterium]|nr:S9 family peptidase [Candidatus Limnocylindrales bacterium]